MPIVFTITLLATLAIAAAITPRAGPALLDVGVYEALPPTYFGGFSVAESTYDEDANLRGASDERGVDGWEPQEPNPYFKHAASPAVFHESPSGGSQEAWQTHWPAFSSGIGGKSKAVGEWQRGYAGLWYQEYKRPASLDITGRIGPRPADWFDASVDQRDGFGRRKEPSPLSGRRYSGGTRAGGRAGHRGQRHGWEERSVNTTLSCADPGCSAAISLQAFKGTTERGKHCHFRIDVHPTDYDHDFEFIEYITVNNVSVSTRCSPGVAGCNATAQKPFHSCVSDLRLDGLMDSSGTLIVGAKINDFVDECPFEGNLLYAVPVVTCLVQPKQPPPLFDSNDPQYAEDLLTAAEAAAGSDLAEDVGGRVVTTLGGRAAIAEAAGPGRTHGRVLGAGPDGPGPAVEAALAAAAQEAAGPNWYYVQAPLKCIEKGCRANLNVILNKTAVALMDRCLLTIEVNQTDYDNDHDSVEIIDFVNLFGENVAEDVFRFAPGINPCKTLWMTQHEVPLSQRIYTVVDGLDITDRCSGGSLMFQGKITDHVDECPSQGFELDGLVKVNCSASPPSATPEVEASLSNSSSLSNETNIAEDQDNATSANDTEISALASAKSIATFYSMPSEEAAPFDLSNPPAALLGSKPSLRGER